MREASLLATSRSNITGTPKWSSGGMQEVDSRIRKLVSAEQWNELLTSDQAVVMRTGDDQEATGLYKIKSTAHSWDDSSHVVSFEDRGDATNFCYLLQSFFEHVDNFDTDIIPIPIKELDEAVTSHGMEVVIVKKGQLKLYSGQPLSEVEMPLRSLVEQS